MIWICNIYANFQVYANFALDFLPQHGYGKLKATIFYNTVEDAHNVGKHPLRKAKQQPLKICKNPLQIEHLFSRI